MQDLGQDSGEPESDIHREARLLLRAARSGSLAVILDGAPIIALVTPAIGFDGTPLLLLSRLAAHTRALDSNRRCALMVAGETPDPNPQTYPRLSLTCLAAHSNAEADRAHYLAIHPYAASYAGFADFGIFRLNILAARFVGGFARAADLDPAKLAPAAGALHDRAANEAAIASVNETGGPILDAIAHRRGGNGEGWRAVTLDRDGFDLARGETVLRIEFRNTLHQYTDFQHEISRL
ncbi:MAG TPA: pyridoxamine 5-phosphate oxidase [Acidiphilium sp.]